MPAKRKALAETTHNTRSTKVAKKAGKESLPAAKEPTTNSSNTTKPAKKAAAKDPSPKSSNSAKPAKKGAAKGSSTKEKEKNDASSKTSKDKDNSLKTGYINLQWPKFEGIDDEDQDVPADGKWTDEWIYRVSDIGIPVTDAGSDLLEILADEAEKRNQDKRDMHIYEDWNGWGVSEVMSNMLKDFDRDLSKKNVDPYKLWSYVEAFACFLICEDFYMMYWMGNEDGPGVGEIINMIGVMILTTLEKLSEHKLLKPDSDIKNLPIMCLLLLEFLVGDAQDFECGWGCEVVRLCDEAGIDLKKHLRKQVSVTAEYIEEQRASYRKKQENSQYVGGDAYKAFEVKDNWKPKDDYDSTTAGTFSEGERRWYRWDWKSEFPGFKREHPGGHFHDLTKKSKSFLQAHSFL